MFTTGEYEIPKMQCIAYYVATTPPTHHADDAAPQQAWESMSNAGKDTKGIVTNAALI